MNASGETYDSSRGELMSLAWNLRVVYLYANSICARAEVRNDEQPFLHRCEDCAGSITARCYSITRLIVDDMLLWIKFIKKPKREIPIPGRHSSRGTRNTKGRRACCRWSANRSCSKIHVKITFINRSTFCRGKKKEKLTLKFRPASEYSAS